MVMQEGGNKEDVEMKCQSVVRVLRVGRGVKVCGMVEGKKEWKRRRGGKKGWCEEGWKRREGGCVGGREGGKNGVAESQEEYEV